MRPKRSTVASLLTSKSGPVGTPAALNRRARSTSRAGEPGLARLLPMKTATQPPSGRTAIWGRAHPRSLAERGGGQVVRRRPEGRAALLPALYCGKPVLLDEPFVRRIVIDELFPGRVPIQFSSEPDRNDAEMADGN